ncbi:MAG: hypothetical protein COT74_06140 [Bdellovibrionales bacterium CG10_big_fil_rev_8_21_14_0_10_45_34]|nr:MAG: hypothetical protein COT74_06140 [Bdellovibrionales bacterium CG10_big_fil_rev_8_21_14_0_10_45_34]
MEFAKVPEIVHSKFFRPLFNTAIFDGPVRVYFSQNLEAEALKVYFCVRDRLAPLFQNANENEASGHLFVMLYPNATTFGEVFDGITPFEVHELDGSIVLGLNSVSAVEQIEEICDRVVPRIQRDSASGEVILLSSIPS